MSVISEALAMLIPMSQAIDPRTDLIFGENHICYDPTIQRALVVAITILERDAQHPSRISDPQSPRQYEPWPPAEDVQLADEVAGGVPMTEMARRHGRSRGAIQSRLRKSNFA